MIKCFLVPMVEPPYSKYNPQRPKYMDGLRLNWSGVPLMSCHYYLVKVNSTSEKLNLLQASLGVIDFPNNDGDLLEEMSPERKQKNTLILDKVKLKEKPNEKTVEFINRVANSEVDHKWDKNKIFVPEE